jgi:hypothetical protein
MRYHIVLAVILLLKSVLIAAAQQNFFNVPSSDITEKNKVFFQQQFNIGSGLVQLNSTLCWGLGKGAEVGFNVTGLNINTTGAGNLFLVNSNLDYSPVYPFYTINAQKSFDLFKNFRLAFGTQTGISVGSHFGSYAYSNTITNLPGWNTKLVIGLYGATDSFLGPEDRNIFFSGLNSLGFQIGVEQPIIREKFFLIVENINGKHSLGETTLGGAYYFTSHWVFSVGYQFPNPQSKTVESLVIEMTYVPRSHR